MRNVVIKAICLFITVDVEQPYRELFIWAVFCCRVPLAMIFFKECPDQLGSTLIASWMFKSLALEAMSANHQELVNELVSNARLIVSCLLFAEFIYLFIYL